MPDQVGASVHAPALLGQLGAQGLAVGQPPRQPLAHIPATTIAAAATAAVWVKASAHAPAQLGQVSAKAFKGAFET